MKMKDLMDLTMAELLVKSRDLRQELFNLQLQKVNAQLEKPHKFKEIRRDIARIETRISQLRKAEAQKVKQS